MWQSVGNAEKATELFTAVNSDARVNTVKELLDSGAPVDAANQQGVTPLMLASYLGNLATVRLLLERGANVNAVEAKGNSPLIYALAHDRPESNAQVVQQLLAAGANPNHVAKRGDTPLMVLSRSDHLRKRFGEFSAIVNMGGDLNVQDHGGRTPLMNMVITLDATTPDEVAMLELAFRQGIDLTLRDKEGMTVADVVRTKNNKTIHDLFESYLAPAH